MPIDAVVLVLCSAGLHLVWNAAARHSGGNLRFLWLLTLGGGICGLVLFGGALLSASFWAFWPFIAGTCLVHGGYFYTLGRMYESGELSRVYPIARGTGVLLTAPAAWLIIGQTMPSLSWVGIVLVTAGLFLLALPGRGGGALKRAALAPALLVGVCSCAYSLIDGVAVLHVAPLPYETCQFCGASLLLTPLALRARQLGKSSVALLSGIASFASYALLLYAYRLAAVPADLALRQIASALSPFVGWAFLRERPRAMQIGGAIVLAIGAVCVIL